MERSVDFHGVFSTSFEVSWGSHDKKASFMNRRHEGIWEDAWQWGKDNEDLDAEKQMKLKEN